MDFISIDMFASLAGCIAIVALVTQALKTYITKLNSLTISLIVSIIIGVVRIFVIGDYSATGIIEGGLNVFVIMLAAGGSYDTVKAIFNRKQEVVDEVVEEEIEEEVE